MIRMDKSGSAIQLSAKLLNSTLRKVIKDTSNIANQIAEDEKLARELADTMNQDSKSSKDFDSKFKQEFELATKLSEESYKAEQILRKYKESLKLVIDQNKLLDIQNKVYSDNLFKLTAQINSLTESAKNINDDEKLFTATLEMSALEAKLSEAEKNLKTSLNFLGQSYLEVDELKKTIKDYEIKFEQLNNEKYEIEQRNIELEKTVQKQEEIIQGQEETISNAGRTLDAMGNKLRDISKENEQLKLSNKKITDGFIKLQIVSSEALDGITFLEKRNEELTQQNEDLPAENARLRIENMELRVPHNTDQRISDLITTRRREIESRKSEDLESSWTSRSSDRSGFTKNQ